MVGKSGAEGPARAPGRPRTFDADAALDQAVAVFWSLGFDGASLDDLTAAMGVSRPSLYAVWGDKRRLFLAALERYAGGIGSEAFRIFDAEPKVAVAVRGFLQASLDQNTRGDCPPGCLLGTCASAVTEAWPEVGAYLRGVRAAGRRRLAGRFEAEAEGGRLPGGFPAEERADLLLDLMQAQAQRARLGEPRAAIATSIKERAAMVLST